MKRLLLHSIPAERRVLRGEVLNGVVLNGAVLNRTELNSMVSEKGANRPAGKSRNLNE